MHVSIDVQDHVYVWGVNDTIADVAGELTVSILDLESGKLTHRLTLPASIPAGDSRILTDLDAVGQFRMTSVLHAKLADGDGETFSCDFEYLKPERSLTFPDARLSLSMTEEGGLAVSADRFARCVELGGDEAGDAFGWYFEDNYFDLMPGERRELCVHGKHRKGVITAKARYASEAARIEYDYSRTRDAMA